MSATDRARLLAEATKIVNGQRNTFYDEPAENFRRIGALWSAYLNVPINEADVAILNVLQKVARLAYSQDHWDSWLDIAGYAATGADVTGAS